MADDSPPGTNGVDPHAGASDRLNSWKEIATYLGKGVRTVQRWESQMGLPVRRLGREGGEIVYALKSEIDAWILSGGRNRESEPLKELSNQSAVVENDPAPASPLPSAAVGPPPPQVRPFLPRWLWALPAVIVLFGLAMSASEHMRPGLVAPVRNPVGATCELGALRAWDSDGKTLWSAPLGIPCDARLDTRIVVDPLRSHRRIAVEDIDGDGSAEVLIVTLSANGSGDNLRVFNADGSSRFTHVPGRPVTYGKEAYRGFNAYAIYLINENAGRISLWLTASHVPWFPTILQQLSPSGEVMSEYWNNGHIMTVRPVTLRGRPFLLVGGFNNESRGGSLALLDRTRANGTAPAENDKYRCKDCADGGPEEFLVFPNADITKEATGGEGSASVTDAILTGQEDIVLTVHQIHARVPGEADAQTATVNYTLSAADLTLQKLEVSGAYRSIHKAFERAGRLDHPMGAEEEKALGAVVRWNGTRFVPVAQTPNDPRIVRNRKPQSERVGLLPTGGSAAREFLRPSGDQVEASRFRVLREFQKSFLACVRPSALHLDLAGGEPNPELMVEQLIFGGGRPSTYDAAGTLQGAGLAVTLQPNSTDFRTAAQVGVPSGASAGIVVTHNAAVGAVSGNVTALNPASGLSFDSPFTPRTPSILGPPLR